MLLSKGLALPLWAVQKQICGSVDLIVQHQIRVSAQGLRFGRPCSGGVRDERRAAEVVPKLQMVSGEAIDAVLGVTS